MRRLLLAATTALALTGVARAETVAITHARILTAGPAGEIADGTLVLKDNRIIAVGAKVAIPAGARVIDATGSTVSPGLFAANTRLGALEINALGNDVTADNDSVSAAFDPQYGLNPDSVLIPVARLGGITRAVVMPVSSAGGGGNDEHADDGGAEETAGSGDTPNRSSHLFAGQALAVHLAAGPDILMKPGVAMVVPFGQAGARAAGGGRGTQIVALKAAFADVRTYMKNKQAFDRADLRDLGLSRADLEALVPVVQGRMPIVAEVHRAADIRAVLKLAKDEGLKVILAGAEEGWRVADEIAKAGVPVILNPLTDRPDSMEILGSTMENAARLNAAGVMIAIDAESSHRIRETRYNAGNAVAHGLPYAAALAAVTLNPARIFGVADQVGSLEPGKLADLVIWSGDPFEPLTRPKAIFIGGAEQPMTSRQLQLQDRYKTLNGAMPPGYVK